MPITITELDGRFSPNGRRLTVLQPLTFISGAITVVVPSGFVSDFNSTPWGTWNLFAPWEFPRAGVVHDRIYFTGELPRQVADACHHQILVHDGMPAWKAAIAYRMLRLLGWRAWNRYRDAEQPPRPLSDEARDKVRDDRLRLE